MSFPSVNTVSQSIHSSVQVNDRPSTPQQLIECIRKCWFDTPMGARGTCAFYMPESKQPFLEVTIYEDPSMRLAWSRKPKNMQTESIDPYVRRLSYTGKPSSSDDLPQDPDVTTYPEDTLPISEKRRTSEGTIKINWTAPPQAWTESLQRKLREQILHFSGQQLGAWQRERYVESLAYSHTL